MNILVEKALLVLAHAARIGIAAALLWVAIQPAVAAERAAPDKHFVVYDSIRNRGKPNLASFGLLKLTPIFGPHWAKPGAASGKLDEAAVTQSIQKGLPQNPAGNVAFLDIENLPIYGVSAAIADAHVARLMRVAQLVRASRPQVRFGFYGVLPVRLFKPLLAGDERAMERWREADGRAAAIARQVDFIFPSLYTLDDDPGHWETFAKAMLQEARRYGRPVYPFIWPVYHDSNPRLGGMPLPAAFWRQQLEFCWQYADGVVIWGSAHDDWDDHAAWWLQTQDFLRAHGLAGQQAVKGDRNGGPVH